ncbi:MAG: hypothetical protein OFPII_31510 [Osedax symbiont Rs1]|nr:MAG: hypothetical protein OFPII_31510 [Osedax symbiont Rs1]
MLSKLKIHSAQVYMASSKLISTSRILSPIIGNIILAVAVDRKNLDHI